MRKIFLQFVLLVLFSNLFCSAQSGKIDSTFGNNGKTTEFFWTYHIKVLQDDKLLIANYIGGAGIKKNNFGLAKFNSNGKVDSLFGNNGRAIGTNDPDAKEGCDGLGFQSDGKIVVCNSGASFDHFVIARYNSNGTLDETFGTNGFTKTIWGSWIQSSVLIVQVDDKIIVGGTGYLGGSSRGFILIRYNSDGSIDNSFGNLGRVSTIFSRPVANLKDLCIQPDGKILAAGYTDSTGFDPHYKYAIARYNPNGSQDFSFGIAGTLELYSSTYYPEGGLYSVLVQPDSKIVLAGNYFDPNINSNYSYACIIRLHDDGSVDSGFGNNGLILQLFDTLNTSGNCFYDLCLQSDNKIISVGELHYNFNDSTNFAMARYNTNGSIDTVFGFKGKVVFWDGIPYKIGLQSTGKIITAVGNLIRFNNDIILGAIDLSVSDNPLSFIPIQYNHQ